MQKKNNLNSKSFIKFNFLVYKNDDRCWYHETQNVLSEGDFSLLNQLVLQRCKVQLCF